MSYTQLRNPPAPFTPPNQQQQPQQQPSIQLHQQYVPTRIAIMSNNVGINNQQQQQQQQQQQHTPNQQQQQTSAQQQQQTQQQQQQIQQPSTNPQSRGMAPAQQSNQQPNQAQASSQQQQQQNTFHPAQQQQQQSVQQAAPQIIQAPMQATQFPYVADLSGANAAPFIYPTNQRILGQPGGQVPTAQGAQPAPQNNAYNTGHFIYNPAYTYAANSAHISYYDPNIAQPIYAQNAHYPGQPGFPITYPNWTQQAIPLQIGQIQTTRYQQAQVNENTQQQQIQMQQTVQQSQHHQTPNGHHIVQGQTAQIHTIIQQQQQQQHQSPSQQQPQNSQPSQQPNVQQQQQQSQQQTHHTNVQPHAHIQMQQNQINPQLIATGPQPQATAAVFTPGQYSLPPHHMVAAPQIPVQQQPVVAPPAPAPYQKRERKPLLIVDPTTKQVVNSTAVSNAATTTAVTTASTTATSATTATTDKIETTTKENLTKSQTQPSISAIASSNQSSAQPASVSTSASVSASLSSSANTQQSTTPSTTTTTTTTTATKQETSIASTTKTGNNSVAPPTAAQIVAGSTGVPANKATESNQLNSNENKKKDLQTDFALNVLKKKQEDDMKSKQMPPASAPTNAPSSTATATTAAPVVVTAATVVAGLAAPSKQTSSITAEQAKPIVAQKQQQQQQQQQSSQAKPQVEPAKQAAQSSTESSATTLPTATVASGPPKPISYSNIVVKSVPKTAIATSKQAPTQQSAPVNSQQHQSANAPLANNNNNNNNIQNTITITNSNVTDIKSTKPSTSQPTVGPDAGKFKAAGDKANPATKTQAPTPTTTTTVTTAPSVSAAEVVKSKEPEAVVSAKPALKSNTKSETDKKSLPTESQPAPTLSETTVAASESKEDDHKKASVLTNETVLPAQKMPAPAAESINSTTTLPDTTASEIPAKQPTPPPQIEVTKADEQLSTIAKSDIELDCWTPENKGAKKRYDREFLLSLKDKKLSKMFPEVLLNFEMAVMEPSKPNQQSMSTEYGGGRSSFGGRGSFGGNSMDNSKGSKNFKGYSKGGKKESFQGNQPSVVINLPQRPEILIGKAENPYVIKKLANIELNEEEELFREVRSILNKLTPENLQKLTGSLINLPITTESRLKGSIDIIFEKAIDEQVFSQTYGQLCKVLSQIKVPSSTEPNKNVNFRTMLLTRCQKEFDTDYQQDVSYDKLIQDANKTEDETQRKELIELANYKLAKAKRRSLGNIRFIGELFKLCMLTEGIMNDCIERLLKQESDEENIECLCRLLTTIGKDLDKPNNVQQCNKMKNYFERLERIIKKKDEKTGQFLTTARTRFMILDVIDLRKNQWVPRRKDNAPRRIEDIRKEAEEEQLRLQAEIEKNQQNERNLRQGQNQNQRGGGQRGSMGAYGSQHSLKSSSMDSENRGQKREQNQNMVKKITEMKSITTPNNTDLLLGPGGGTKGWNSWNKAKPVEPQQQQQQPTMTSSASTSSFKYQSNDDKYSNDTKRNLTSYNSSTGFNKVNKQNSSEMTSRLSMDSNKGLNFKDRQVQNIKKMEGSQGSLRRDGSSQASSRETSTSRPSVDSRDSSRTRNDDSVGKSYSYDEIERKVTNTLDEYIQNNDLSEALKDCEEFRPSNPSQIVDFIEQAILKILERTEAARTAVGVLFFNVLKEKKFDTLSFTKALRNILETAEDMAIDVPKITTYLSQIIAPFVQKDASIEFLSEACSPIKDTAICAEFITEMLHYASNRLGHSTVAEVFRTSNLKIHDFLQGVPNSTQYIKEKNLEWIIGNRERTQSASVSTESYEKKLYQILQSPTIENDVIFDKIECEFSDSDCVSKAFIRALVTSVCRSCLSAENKLDPVLFKKRNPILTKYINRNEDNELESLFAVQALDHKMQHQPGFIRVLFDLFYDEDIISETVFWTWKKEAREEGHAISALSLKVFFEWLSEAEPNE